MIDAIIIGGGHNGLVCANYLAMAGKRVKIYERRDIVGGAAVTEEFHPGFRNSVASYTVSLLNPKVISDLELNKYGLQIVHRKVNNFWPHKNGNCLAFLLDDNELRKEISQFSIEDSRALDRYFRDINMVADLIREFLLETPPNVGSGIKEIFKTIKFGNRLRKLSIEDQRIVMDIFTKSVSDFLNNYFENQYVKGAFAFDGIVGNYASSETPGSAYVLMHHAFGEVNGVRGVWGHAIGGMGSITDAMSKSAAAKDVEIELGTSVKRVIIKNNKACGVLLDNGDMEEAKIIVSNLNPSLLYNQLIGEGELPLDFSRRMKNYKNGSGTFRMNVALDKLPEFSCLNNQLRTNLDYLTGGIIIAPTCEYIDKAYLDSKLNGWSKEPIVEMLIPTTLDKTLAPEGKHVASLFCQQFDPDVDWDTNREEVAELIVDTVEIYAPGFKNSILGKQIFSPLDLERVFGLVKGDIMHGNMSLDQIFSARPMIGYGNYRSPIKNLYLCGAGTHPGGGVTGAPGHNAAYEILKDIK
ncbi:MAG: NAD(P)/FAD-dependent oxidoreductase [Hellea sp.]|nr:NAD(P)/FAD-dependent oxidoreductase [Hellea sp.]